MFKKFKLVHFLTIIIVFFTFFLFFKDLLYPQLRIYSTPDFGRSEIWSLNYPLKEFLSSSLKKRQLPFWSRQIGGGYPVFAEGLIGTFYLPNLILFGILPTPIAWNVSYIISFLLMFLGTFLFAYVNIKDFYSSVFAGLVFTFCGYNVVHIPHFPLLQAFSIFPLVLWSGQILLEKPKKSSIFLFSFLLSQQIFVGHPQVTFMTLLAFSVLAAVKSKKEKSIRFKTKPVVLAVLFGVLLASPQIVPSLELYPNTIISIKSMSGLSELSKFPYYPKYLMTTVLPNIRDLENSISFPILKNGNGVYWEVNSFMGVLPFLLSIYGIFKKRKGVFERFLVTTFFVSLGLCFFWIFPLRYIFLLPGFNLFRVTSRFLLLTSFAMSLLSGVGLSMLLRKVEKKVLKRFLYFGVLAISITQLTLFGKNYNPTVSFSEFLITPQIASDIKETERIYDDSSVYAAWNSVLKSEGFGNSSEFLFFKNALDGYAPLLYGISNSESEISAPLKRQAILIKYPDYGLMGSFSVNYLITSRILPKESPFQLLNIYNSDTEGYPVYYLYKNNDVLPRVRIVNEFEIRRFNYSNPDWNFSGKGMTFRNAVLIEENPSYTSSFSNIKKVEMITDTDRTLIVDAQIDAPSFLVVADTLYPGWFAWINGKRVKILYANINQRAVILPSGRSTVVMKYIPVSFYIGVFILFLALLWFWKLKVDSENYVC